MKQNVRYKVMYRHIARCMLVLLLSFVCLTSFGQGRTVTGLIADENGSPLPGVNVIIKGTTTGSVTDLDGKFSLNVPGDETILAFSFVGYTSQEIQVGQQTVINVTLKEEVKQLNEVVVIGYGVQKKSDLTGAVASVKADELTKVPVTGVESALQGRAAGVQVSQNTGAPGSDVTVRIRGISTLTIVNGKNQGGPLWVVDGVVVGDANSVNTNDIESMEILKDASSAAIYGANGGSGVILITTKKGKAGKAEVNVNYYHGYQDVPKRLDMATGPEYAATYTEMEALRGLTTFRYQNYHGYKNFSDFPTYNYQNFVFRVAPMDNLDFSVSGGNEKLKAYLGMGYVNQDGILKASSFHKFNFRINSDFDVNKWFKVGETMSFTQQTTSGFEEWQYTNEYASPIMGALQILPYYPPYDSTGNFVSKEYGVAGDPLVGIDLLHKATSRYEGHGTFYGIIEPLKGLAIESRISSGLTYDDNYNFSPTYSYGNGAGETNTISSILRGMDKNISYIWQNIARYNTTLMNSFNIGAMVGFESGATEYMNMSGTRRNLLTEKPEMWYFDASQDATTAGIQLITGSGSKGAGYSYLGRISLDYKDRYLVQANFRRDYSSKFGPDSRAGSFPGISVGWKFSEEDFIKNILPVLSFGKLRYAWGNAGNNAIRNYAYYSTAAVLQHWLYAFGNTTAETVGAGPNVFANTSIHWEDVRTQNYGADLTFLNNKLSVTIDKFYNHNIGMLRPSTVPGLAGWTVRDIFQESASIDPRPITNIGKITNSGWEITLGWKDALGKLKYSFEFSYTYANTVATDLGPDSVIVGGTSNGFASNITRTVTGGAVGDFYGYKVERLFTINDATRLVKRGKNWVPVITDQPYTTVANAANPSKLDTTFAQGNAQAGDIKWVDINHDNRITTADQASIGNPNPKNLFGLNMNFEYGIFDLTLFWQGTFGNKIFNTTKYYGVVSSGDYNWSEDYVKNHYRATDVVAANSNGDVFATFPANTNAKYPRIDYGNKNSPGNFGTISDFYVEDGSYLRLKNIQLGIKLPKAWTNKLAISEFRIYAGAKNVLTFTKYSGMDPEVPQSDPLISGIDKAAYPQARSIIFGASIRF